MGVELVEQTGDPVVDVFAAVVGMNAQNPERKAFQQGVPGKARKASGIPVFVQGVMKHMPARRSVQVLVRLVRLRLSLDSRPLFRLFSFGVGGVLRLWNQVSIISSFSELGRNPW
jgi:hypothetical protein